MKKIILTVFAASSLLLYSTQAFALFSVSVGMPLGYGSNSNMEGYFLGVQLPFALGLGMDSHKLKFGDTGSTTELHTNMYNLFYQLPIPVINLIFGLGTGNQEYKCDDAGNGLSCSDVWDKGSATQLYTSLGFPIIPFFDIHLSYRSVTAKIIKIKGTELKDDNSGSVTGIGLAFNI